MMMSTELLELSALVDDEWHSNLWRGQGPPSQPVRL